MQKLHLVGFTTEHDGLVFSARKGSKAGGYIVTLDKELLSTIAEAERLRNGDKGDEEGAGPRVRPTSRLTPREIQAHLRAGRSIPEVAAEAGVDAEWVERFAVPVVAEQAQMVERARALTYSKARLGQSTQPLGTSVRWNLVDKGVTIGEEEFEQGWSAFQLQDEVWMIRFRYTSRQRLQVAEWELDLDTNQLVSRNRLASELGYVEKGRRPPALPAPAPRVPAAAPVRVVEEVVEEPEPEPEERPAPRPPARRTRRRATSRRTRRTAPRKKSAVRKAPAKKSPTKRAATKKATAKTSTAKKTTTKKTSAKKATPKKTSTKRATPKRATKKRAARKTTKPTATKATRRRPRPQASARPDPQPRQRTERRPRQPAEPRKIGTPAPPRLAATKRRAEQRRPLTTRPQAPPFEPDVDGFDEPDVPPTPRSQDQSARPRIAASSAREAAKRPANGAPRPTQPATGPRPRPARKVRKVSKSENASTRNAAAPKPQASPALSGPLARSLLARRLAARKAAPGNGGQPAPKSQQSQRPLRVK